MIIFLKIYQEYKNEIYNFRKTHGWHTENGRERISKARKGKTPCIDSKTGKIIGSVDNTHPKVLSGEWIHHTKGWTTAIDLKSGNKVRVKSGGVDGINYKSIYKNDGENNSRFKKDFYTSFEEFIKEAESFFKDIGLIISDNSILKLKRNGCDHPFVKKFVKSDYRKKLFGIKNYNEEFNKIKGLPSAAYKSGLPKLLKEKYSVKSVEEYLKIKLKELNYA